MDLPKVTIQIVAWNSLKFLPACLKSIFNQTYRDFQVLVIDNNSGDGTVDFLRRNYPEVTVFQNKRNYGFAKANNQGINLLHSPYVVFCNPDIILESNWLETIMQKVESGRYDGVGSFGGQLKKIKLVDGEIEVEGKTDIIDSCGLQVLRNRRVIEVGAGQPSVDFADEREVFGHSGALTLYKRKALLELLLKTKKTPQGEYFDEDFFAYKEDVDLAWRLRIFGWRSVFFPTAVAYHVRSLAGSENRQIGRIIKNRQGQSAFAKYYSYRNHLLLLMKNEFAHNFFRDWWRILWQEKKKAVYILVFEGRNLRAWWDVIRLMPAMREKRKLILRRAKVSPRDIEKWFK